LLRLAVEAAMPTSDPVTAVVPMHTNEFEGRQHEVTDGSGGAWTENEGMKGVDVDGDVVADGAFNGSTQNGELVSLAARIRASAGPRRWSGRPRYIEQTP
jgi:hypothetical protein